MGPLRLCIPDTMVMDFIGPEKVRIKMPINNFAHGTFHEIHGAVPVENAAGSQYRRPTYYKENAKGRKYLINIQNTPTFNEISLENDTQCVAEVQIVNTTH